MPRFSRTSAFGLLGLVLLAPVGLAACTVVERPAYRTHYQPYYGPGYRAPVIVLPAPRGYYRDYDRHDHRHRHRR